PVLPAGPGTWRGLSGPLTHLAHAAGRVEPHPVLDPGRLQGEPVWCFRRFIIATEKATQTPRESSVVGKRFLRRDCLSVAEENGMIYPEC
ncbi:mCG145845, partial [Mus musculus]